VVATPDGTCIGCHLQKVNNILTGHFGQVVLTDGNGVLAGSVIGCLTCHVGPPWTKIAAVGGIEHATCDTCHETRAALHEAAHDNRVIDPVCAQCHSSDTTVLGQPGNGTLESQSDINILHRSDCTLCHAYTGSLLDPQTVAQSIDSGINGSQISCNSCHTVLHHTGTDWVSYAAAVDTSQGCEQGCAVCHHDYDTVNGTSTGLGTWMAILYEHDLDGSKDGSPNTCMTCHGYDGSASPSLQTVQQVIAAGVPATCCSCHTDKVPDEAHGTPVNGQHSRHLAVPGVSCMTCHNTDRFPYFKSGTDANGDGLYDFGETDVCNPCHSPVGAFDGVNDPEVGAKANWLSGVYTEDGSLQAGKEGWCVTCHDDVPAVIDGVAAPNVAGDGSTYGFYQTGHGTTSAYNATRHQQNGPGYDCLVCHDATSPHISGIAGDTKRLRSVPDDEDPSTTAVTEVCLDCHRVGQSEVGVLGYDATAEATIHSGAVNGNFNTASAAAFPAYGDADDYEAHPGYQCTDCHNPHGTSKLAMVRETLDGRLAGESAPRAVVGFAASEEDLTDLDPSYEADDGVCDLCHIEGGEPHPDTYHPGNHNQGINGLACIQCHSHTSSFAHGSGGASGTGCDTCHGHDAGYNGDGTGGRGTYASHSTHTEDDEDDVKGPHVDCDACHDTGNFPYFKSGTDIDGDGRITLAETDVCNSCHSPGGSYDGVNDPAIGAKANWSSGVYAATDDSTLRAGKVKWCAGCHDEEPSVIQGVSAPNIIGDEDGAYTYGTGWGYYKTGHGLAAGEAYPSKGGLIEPSLVDGASRPVTCDSCHDLSAAHIDGEPRTYDDGDNSSTDPSVYREAYRLDLVPVSQGTGASGQEPLLVPRPKDNANVANNSRLCFNCHDSSPFLDSADMNTNLVTGGVNRHEYHMGEMNWSILWQADWSGSYTSLTTCVTCHNVHGSTRLAMVRDGKLVSQTPGVYDYDGGGDGPEPGLEIWYKNDAITTNIGTTNPPVPADLPLAASDGTAWINNTSKNLCVSCHGNAQLEGEGRTPFQDLEQAPTLDWTGETGYVTAGANPDSGVSGSTFTFRVKYTDTNNEAPSPINLLIDTDNDGNVDDTYSMTATDVGDVNYMNGVIYSRALALTDSGSNVFQFKFAAFDGTSPATGTPTEWSAVSLLAGEVKNPPELAWVTWGATCGYQGVSPATAVSGSPFEFRVTYTDADDECPAAGNIQVWIDKNDDGDFDDTEKLDPTGNDGNPCASGRVYTFNTTLSHAGDGMLNYRFVASDGTDAATGGPTGMQSVTVIDSGLTPVTVCASSCGATSIQAGVTAALGVDHVTLVYEGTYPENLVLNNSGTNYSNSKVYAACGPDATIISNTGNVVFLQNVTGIVIDGFGITGGSTGIYSNGAPALINRCKIHDNSNSTGRGGGLYTGVSAGILTVDNSEIYSNTSLGGSAASFNAGYGHSFTNSNIHDNEAIYDGINGWTGSAGAVFTQNGSVTFTDSTIKDNTSHGNGGAVYSNGSAVNFIRSTITGNTSTAGSGGAIALGNGTENAYLENCIVADNQAINGGVAFVNGAAFTAVYSTFVKNQATAGDGGALWQQNATNEFRNSILWNNTASDEGHIAWSSGGSITITDTVISSGSDGIPNNAPYFTGNVTPSIGGYVSENDPFFVDAEKGDYHLKNFSPAIDQGTAEDPPISVDIDGDARPFDCVGLGDGVDDYDIGADEVTSPAPIDSLSTSNPTAIQTGSVDADESIVMSRFQVDCDDTGDSQCILSSVTVDDIGTGLSGDWDNLEIYIDTDTDITGATLIGRKASWDGSAKTVLLNQGIQADRTVTNGTPKYVFIVYDLTEAAEGTILKSRVTQMNALFPDNGFTGLSYESNIVTVNGDTLSTLNNTAIQSSDPYAGQANIVMQRFQTDCGTAGNNACILSSIKVDDMGTATAGDWDSLKIYIDTDTDFSGATLIGQTYFDGTSKAVTLDQGTVADRTVTNGTPKYIFIVYDINSGAAGKTMQSRVTGVSVQSPDNGVTGFIYNSNLLTIQASVVGDNLSTSNPAAVHLEYAAQGEDGAIMERFQVNCDTAGDSNCILSSITVEDLGTASTGDWDNLKIYIGTDTSFAGATLIGQTSSWGGTSTIVSLSLGAVADRTVTNGTPKYVFVVYDLSASIVVDTTLQSRVTAVGVSSPDSGVTGFTYDSHVVTVKYAKYVPSVLYPTIQAAVNAASNGDMIIVSDGTYYENVNHSPSSGTKLLHIYSASGPENTIIDGGANGSVVTLGYRSSTSTLSGFTITNGDASLSIGGGGIYIDMAQPTIDNCIITGNDAGTYPGGGIFVNNSISDVTITNTTISNNTGGNGGGLYLPSGTNATISNVVFDQNTGDLGGAIYFNATDSTTSITESTFTGNFSTGAGGAFFIQGVNGIKFSRCTITGNHADDNQYGGGVLRTGNSTSNTTFENCIIAGNYAPVAGVFSVNGGAMTLINSTVADNHATADYYGGGIASICTGTVNMTNSIAWGNSAATGNGHAVYKTCGSGNVGTIAYSDFEGWPGSGLPGAPYLYNCSVTDGGGNIAPATDPNFVDDDDPAPYDYHLTSSSTNVIDAGTSSGAPADDIDGNSRGYDGDGLGSGSTGDGSDYDMGADEYVP